MTDTTTTTDAISDQAIGTLEYLDPIMLEIGDNVRNEAALSKEFLASIAENGVLVPITGIRHPDNNNVIRVRNGQRRTLAAREVGIAAVPVFVLPSSAADASEETIERIVHQIVTNDQKQDLTDAQRVRGIQQLLETGVSVTKVAKKLSVKKDTVKAAETVGKSDAATAAFSDGQLSLAEAAALTEFEDLPGALNRLAHVAGTPRFDQVVAQLREEQMSWKAQQDAEAQWRDKGFTVLDEPPRSWDESCVGLEHLRTADGASVDEDAITDPAQWAVLIEEDTALIDVETSEVIEESAIDWNTHDDPEATPEEGMRHAKTVEDGTVYLPTFYCLDYAAAGFTLDTWFRRNAGIGDDADDTSPGDAVDLDNETDANGPVGYRRRHSTLRRVPDT
ncbi:ParB/RepB/Spo0J family partition protein [Mycobacterium sp. NPDC003323]